MKIPNKQELQHVAFNHSSDMGLKGFMNFYKKMLQNHIFLVIDATLASDNPLSYKKNFLEKT